MTSAILQYARVYGGRAPTPTAVDNALSEMLPPTKDNMISVAKAIRNVCMDNDTLTEFFSE